MAVLKPELVLNPGEILDEVILQVVVLPEALCPLLRELRDELRLIKKRAEGRRRARVRARVWKPSA